MDNDQLQYFANKLAYEIDPYDLNVTIKGGEKIIVIDTRVPEAFAEEHIPRTISLPHRTMTEATTAALDRSTLVVTYCDGIGCNGSTKGALNMTRLGFRVKELIGGFQWWKLDGYPTEGRGASNGARPACACNSSRE